MLIAAAWPAGLGSLARAAAKRLEVEFGYEIRAMRTKGLTAPLYLSAADGRTLIVSDQAGGLFSVTSGGQAAALPGTDKIKRPAGVAVAPEGFGAYRGQVFVLTSADDASPCEVVRVHEGEVSTFAVLPDAGEGDAAKATGCRDLAFGIAGGPFAGNLYAATSDNSTVYVIDSQAKAQVFGSYRDPVSFELFGMYFTSATDKKAPNSLLIGMRPRGAPVVKVGRIGVIGGDGKLKDDPYYVGLVRPTAFGYAPANWGPYGGVFFIADAGKPAAENQGERDGVILRIEKGVPHSYAANLVDPNCLKFVGPRMYVCDPADKGKPGDGSIVLLTSML
jgi:hypothetical protein